MTVECSVIIVDKSSHAPISHEVLPTGGGGEFPLWLKRNVQILLAPPEAPTKREYGGYAHGLAYLATSWDTSNFMQFVFMQGSMVLSSGLMPMAARCAPCRTSRK